MQHIDRTQVRRVKTDEQETDFVFWQSRTPQERLATLETIRREYHLWKYGTQPGFQRVLRIVKQE